MDQVEFFEWTLAVDTMRTRDAYVHIDVIDAAHCETCAAFVRALEQKLVPAPVVALLQRVGANPFKAHEVWGAPDGGFLAGSWFFIGTLLRGEWTGGSEGASVEISAGFQCWIDSKPTLPPPDVMRGDDLLELGFTWDNPILSTLV